jgi:AcrR family transcriptional regulator
VEKIVHTAIELADTEGFASLSMPKIAKRLGFTANALYRYVRSKDELLVLLADTAWGPPPVLSSAKSWRDAATGWIHALLKRYELHPWLLDLPVKGAPTTPNLLRWMEVIMDSMSASQLDNSDILGCVLLLDGYGRNMAGLIRDLRNSETPAVESAAVAGFLQPLLEEHGFTIMAEMMSGGQYTDEDGLSDDDVEFGLTRILDGIEALIAERRGTTGAAKENLAPAP